MKFMKVAEARARFGEILDQAESGDPVMIERRGVLFRLAVDAEANKRASGGADFAFVDEVVLEGDWSWEPARKGLAFKAARRKAR